MEKVRVEIEVEDRPESRTVEVEGGGLAAIVTKAHEVAGFDDGNLFERDHDDPVGVEIEKRKAISLIVHRCRKVSVKVRYEHQTKEHDFSPAATVLRVLHWAVGKKGFDLDANSAAKANLILPGADQLLPKDAVIGRYVKPGHCELVVDLTLKDFTNG